MYMFDPLNWARPDDLLEISPNTGKIRTRSVELYMKQRNEPRRRKSNRFHSLPLALCVGFVRPKLRILIDQV